MRNERALNSRKCDAPGHSEDLITVYHPDSDYKVVCSEFWWSDKWDPLNYGRDYDFSKPFFQQLLELQKEVPRPSIIMIRSENSDYTNMVSGCKNCYQITSAEKCEDCYFGARIFYSRNCCDCENINDCELCYECFQATKCYRCTFCQKLENCRETHFSYDCRNCTDCIGCTGLRNKSYCYFNEQLTEENYKSKLSEAKIDSRAGIDKLKKLAQESSLKFPRRYAEIIRSENCTGDNISNSQNCNNSFFINQSKNVAYSLNCSEGFDIMDASYSDYCEHVYENMSSEHDSRKKFCCFCWECHDVQYCDYCHSGCSDLFGCVGIQHGRYCILNKQYHKEEYEKLVSKIKKHMEEMPYTTKKGLVYKYGEFFPPEFSAFGYNETVAQEFYPLNEQSATQSGFKWRPVEARDYKAALKAEDLPQTISEVDSEILKQVIYCQHKGKCSDPCTHAYKIVEPELLFYKKMKLPLPILCPICRHFRRVKLRSPLSLWRRQCMNEGCSNEFETTYAPERPERVFCEKCYQENML